MTRPVATTSSPSCGRVRRRRKVDSPDHRVETRILILEAEIGVAGGVRAAIVGDLAAHAHAPEAILDRLLQRVREFGDADLRRIGLRRVSADFGEVGHG